jgi:hypothetical protein
VSGGPWACTRKTLIAFFYFLTINVKCNIGQNGYFTGIFRRLTLASVVIWLEQLQARSSQKQGRFFLPARS